MNYGIILFIYDRPQCTVRALEALKRNHIQELYVFQDGLGEKTNQIGWRQNEELIQNIDWCKVIYEKNERKGRGLNSQIIYGISKVFEQKNEVIVIEDDCIISDDCIKFMEKCFTQYRNNRKVMDVTAYLEPIRIPQNYSLPVVAAGIPGIWGWGTWKDRWEGFQREFFIIKEIGNAIRNKSMFHSCGYLIEKILTYGHHPQLGSWDTWWCLYVLLRDGISIRPTGNKVYNMGCENLGTHAAPDLQWIVPICDRGAEGEFPDNVSVEPWVEAEFKRVYQTDWNKYNPMVDREAYYRSCLEKWLELKQGGAGIGDILLEQNIKKVAVYGMGNIGKLLAKELSEKVKIDYFLVTNKNVDMYMGYPVYGCEDELPEGTEELSLIVVPGYDLDKIKLAVGNNFASVYSLDFLFDAEGR